MGFLINGVAISEKNGMTWTVLIKSFEPVYGSQYKIILSQLLV